MLNKIDLSQAINSLIEKYKDKRHSLKYENIYQLLVMVVLTAQDSDKHIDSLAPKLFKAFPNMDSLTNVTP